MNGALDVLLASADVSDQGRVALAGAVPQLLKLCTAKAGAPPAPDSPRASVDVSGQQSDGNSPQEVTSPASAVPSGSQALVLLSRLVGSAKSRAEALAAAPDMVYTLKGRCCAYCRLGRVL